MLRRFLRQPVAEEEYPREYVDITKLYLIVKKDGTNLVIPATYMQEHKAIENANLVTFNRPYTFSFSGVTFAKTAIGQYQVSYAWDPPSKVTVTKDPLAGIQVFVGEY